MEYIRTKYGIYERTKYPRILNDKGTEVFVINVDKGQDETITAQADTIEELCDEFVVIEVNDIDNKRPYTIPKNLLDDYKLLEQFGGNVKSKITRQIFGAIWTNDGLKYVAKMNEKGELVLL